MTDACRAREITAVMHGELQSLAVKNTPNVRGVRRSFFYALRREDGHVVLQIAHQLCRRHGYRSVPYELILAHQDAFSPLDEQEVEELGRGLDSWWSLA